MLNINLSCVERATETPVAMRGAQSGAGPARRLEGQSAVQ
jgi:hypothetical protein